MKIFYWSKKIKMGNLENGSGGSNEEKKNIIPYVPGRKKEDVEREINIIESESKIDFENNIRVNYLPDDKDKDDSEKRVSNFSVSFVDEIKNNNVISPIFEDYYQKVLSNGIRKNIGKKPHEYLVVKDFEDDKMKKFIENKQIEAQEAYVDVIKYMDNKNLDQNNPEDLEKAKSYIESRLKNPKIHKAVNKLTETANGWLKKLFPEKKEIVKMQSPIIILNEVYQPKKKESLFGRIGNFARKTFETISVTFLERKVQKIEKEAGIISEEEEKGGFLKSLEKNWYSAKEILDIKTEELEKRLSTLENLSMLKKSEADFGYLVQRTESLLSFEKSQELVDFSDKLNDKYQNLNMLKNTLEQTLDGGADLSDISKSIEEKFSDVASEQYDYSMLLAEFEKIKKDIQKKIKENYQKSLNV